MYLLYRLHDKFPGEYYGLPPGEKKIIKQFMIQELKDLKEENETG
ncbi:hypothetical protein [Anaerocolumna jejuensis]